MFINLWVCVCQVCVYLPGFTVHSLWFVCDEVYVFDRAFSVGWISSWLRSRCSELHKTSTLSRWITPEKLMDPITRHSHSPSALNLCFLWLCMLMLFYWYILCRLFLKPHMPVSLVLVLGFTLLNNAELLPNLLRWLHGCCSKPHPFSEAHCLICCTFIKLKLSALEWNMLI